MSEEEKDAWFKFFSETVDIKALMAEVGRKLLAKLERETPSPPGVYPMSGYEVLPPGEPEHDHGGQFF